MRGCRTLCVLALFTVLTSAVVPTQSPRSEYELKAVFLFHFTQFIEWPDSAFSSPHEPLVIGILGSNPFRSYLDEIVKNEVVKGHPLVIRPYRDIQEIRKCHILFISASENQKIEEYIKYLKGRSVLTVSDLPGFVNRGGMIRFIREGNKVRFIVNPEAARTAGLNISSKLLNLAVIKTP